MVELMLLSFEAATLDGSFAVMAELCCHVARFYYKGSLVLPHATFFSLTVTQKSF